MAYVRSAAVCVTASSGEIIWRCFVSVKISVVFDMHYEAILGM